MKEIQFCQIKSATLAHACIDGMKNLNTLVFDLGGKKN
jgi:hypothetical protein